MLEFCFYHNKNILIDDVNNYIITKSLLENVKLWNDQKIMIYEKAHQNFNGIFNS